MSSDETPGPGPEASGGDVPAPDGPGDAAWAGAPDEELDALLVFVRDARNFDFTGYKRASIARRLQRRMSDLGITDITAYHARLEADVDEFAHLFNTILINVTAFFRDPDSWDYVAREIVPKILEHRGEGPVRLWSAGCASGEEAFTLAMVMAEQLGLAETTRRVKIYGTDIDLHALDSARAAVYPASALEAVPEELRARYFQPDLSGGGFAVVPALRRVVVFGRHDLIGDAPISRIDLLTCRNTMMYLNADTQAGVVPRLHFSVVDGGFLFLGRAEMLVHGAAGRFTPVSLRHRVFAALPGRARAVPVLAPARGGTVPGPPGIFDLAAADPPTMSDRARWAALRESLFETNAVAQLVVDPSGVLLAANDGARTLFGIDASEIGLPFRDLRVSFDPVELRAPIEMAVAGRASPDLGVVLHRPPGGGEINLHIMVSPLLSVAGSVLAAVVTCVDVTPIAAMREEFRRVTEDLETAQEELQSTNEELVTSGEELQSTNEELETSNEELQSTNEELETTNEELRSTNEELETANEELRSANEAIEQMNATLIEANDALQRREAFHQGVMTSLPDAIVVLDARLLVDEWNQAATELWGLIEAEVRGHPFFGLDMGLPAEPLQEPVRACLSGASPHQVLAVEAVNRRGRTLTCRVTIVPLVAGGEITGVMLIMATAPG